MSGHSKWAKIKRDKGANDAKRGALFTRIGNQIAVAARAGTDPDMNASLALAIEKAKAANMPVANIQRAIDRVKDKAAAQLEEVTYEGYGPGGIAVLVEAATDNKNRTYPEVRHAFSKNGGNIAEPGSVAFQFVRKGQIVATAEGDPDESLMMALEAGVEDAEIAEGMLSAITDPRELHNARDALNTAGLTVQAAELVYVPSTTITIDDKETARKIMNLMDALDELNDVVATHANFEMSETISLE